MHCRQRNGFRNPAQGINLRDCAVKDKARLLVVGFDEAKATDRNIFRPSGGGPEATGLYLRVNSGVQPFIQKCWKAGIRVQQVEAKRLAGRDVLHV